MGSEGDDGDDDEYQSLPLSLFASLTNMLAADEDDDDAEGGKGRFTREA